MTFLQFIVLSAPSPLPPDRSLPDVHHDHSTIEEAESTVLGEDPFLYVDPYDKSILHGLSHAGGWDSRGGHVWSTDGGKTWKELRNGLPSGTLGRIGLDYSASEPGVVWAVIESDRITQEPENAAWMGLRGENAEVGARVTSVEKDGPADEAGLQREYRRVLQRCLPPGAESNRKQSLRDHEDRRT